MLPFSPIVLIYTWGGNAAANIISMWLCQGKYDMKKQFYIYCTDFTNRPLTTASSRLANQTQNAISTCSALPAVLPFA